MADRPPRLALWVLLPILGGITLAGEFLLFHYGLGADALAAPAVAVVVGLIYLAWAAPARPTPAPLKEAEEEEPFNDPVVEADRVDSEGASPPTADPPAAGSVPEPPAEDAKRDDGLE